MLALCATPGVCSAQNGGGAAQISGAPFGAPEDTSGGVLEIAPQVAAPAPRTAPAAVKPGHQNAPDNHNADDQQSDDQGTATTWRTTQAYSDGEDTAPHPGPLPYLGISVHSTTVLQSDGIQRHALEVLSVDEGSPAAIAGLKGSGTPTTLGASSLTASAMLGPAQEMLAPLLKKTGQLGQQGDLIVAADDNRVGSEEELADELERLKAGDTLWLTVLRESKKGQPKAVRIPVKLAPPQGTGAATAAK